MAELAAEVERNKELKATLASLNGTAAVDNKAATTQAQLQINEVRTAAPRAGANAHAVPTRRRTAQLKRKELAISQSIAKKDLQIKNLEAEQKNSKEDLARVRMQIDEIKNAGKPPWDQVGYGCIPYRDPFHTGLPKRTPTGAPARRVVRRLSLPRGPPLVAVRVCRRPAAWCRRRLLHVVSEQRPGACAFPSAVHSHPLDHTGRQLPPNARVPRCGRPPCTRVRWPLRHVRRARAGRLRAPDSV